MFNYELGIRNEELRKSIRDWRGNGVVPSGARNGAEAEPRKARRDFCKRKKTGTPD